MFVIPQAEGRIPGVHWPISLAYLTSSRPVRGPVSRDVGEERGKWRERKNVWFGYLRKELFRQGDSGYKDPSS